MKQKLLTLAVAAIAVVLGAASVLPGQAAAHSNGSHSNGRYVALGDSIAVGAGLTGGAENPPCFRSNESYVNTVAAEVGMTLENLACVAATTDGGLYGPQTLGPNTFPAQIPTAFAGGKPKLITVSIGANDVQWLQFMFSCFDENTECGGAQDEASMQSLLSSLRWKLVRSLLEIRLRSGLLPVPTVISGYYDPLQGDTCSEVPGLTAAESEWFSEKTQELNELIQTVSGHFHFVEFAPVDFSGHGLCDEDSWVRGTQVIAPVHPTAEGQQAIAEAVLAKIND